jgi:serpin B
MLLKSVALVMVLGQIGCQALASIAPGGSGAIEIAISKKQRSNVSAPKDDLAQLAADNNAFALNLFRALNKDAGNIFHSPYSISSALAMTYAGARGATAQQKAQVMHFGLPADRLHPAFGSLDLTLARRGEGAKGKDGKGFRLNVVNAVWGQKGYQFTPGFLDVLAENYGAGMQLLDFRNSPEDARVTINGWVSDQTENRIKDLLAKGDVDTLTRLVLTNAIYFNAAWAQPFEKEQTHDGPFSLVDGSKVTVRMMNQTTTFKYGQGEGYQAVELPYDKRELSMLILLPPAGRLGALENSLDAERLGAIVKSMTSKRVALTMPKFKVEATLRLADVLRGMGMRDAFQEGTADFSGMDGTRDLFIGQVIHKAFVDVDEAGTEAAAATAVGMRTTAMIMEELVSMTIDRPFIFLIRDSATGAILFVGRVANPAQ